MRSFTLFLLAIIIAATITAPGHKKFISIWQKKEKTSVLAWVVQDIIHIKYSRLTM